MCFCSSLQGYSIELASLLRTVFRCNFDVQDVPDSREYIGYSQAFLFYGTRVRTSCRIIGEAAWDISCLSKDICEKNGVTLNALHKVGCVYSRILFLLPVDHMLQTIPAVSKSNT